MRQAVDDLEVGGLAEGPQPLCERHRVVEHRVEVARLKVQVTGLKIYRYGCHDSKHVWARVLKACVDDRNESMCG